MSAFDDAFAVTVGVEGGYVNDPRDSGGETKFGISKRAYPGLDIAALTIDDAKAIYARDYWAKVSGDDLPPRLAGLVFDAAVNNGVGRAAKWLQEACGVAQDGVIGHGTIAAVRDRLCHVNGELDMCVEFMAQRALFMSELGSWAEFGLGWCRRLFRVAMV